MCFGVEFRHIITDIGSMFRFTWNPTVYPFNSALWPVALFIVHFDGFEKIIVHFPRL